MSTKTPLDLDDVEKLIDKIIPHGFLRATIPCGDHVYIEPSIVKALITEARIARELEDAIREVGMNSVGIYHTNNNVSGYFRIVLERIASLRGGG